MSKPVTAEFPQKFLPSNSINPNFTQTVHQDVYPAIDPEGALKGVARGKKILITGAGRGIGKAIALSFTKSGASVLVLTSRTLSELDEVETECLAISQSSSNSEDVGKLRVIKHRVDVTNKDSVEGLFKRLYEEGIGKFDLLVNNAGAGEQFVTFGERNWGDYETVLDVSIKGTVLPTLLFIRYNLAVTLSSSFHPFNPDSIITSSTLPRPPTDEEYRSALKGVTVVCTSSIGSIAVLPGLSSYQPSKVFINRFVEHLHFQHGLPHGLRVFSYHPGGVATQLGQTLPPEIHNLVLTDSPNLAGGYVVWLLKKKTNSRNEKEEEEGESDFLRGKYSSCNWDVEELVRRKGEIESDDWMLKAKMQLGH